jgi:hypothetical protein
MIDRAKAAFECGRDRLLKAGYRIGTIAEIMNNARVNRRYKFVPNPKFPELQSDWYYGSEQELLDRTKADWVLTDTQLLEFTRKLFLAMRSLHVGVYVHTAHRTDALQERLAQTGYSQISRAGPHQRGAAVDIVHHAYHWQAPKQFWDLIGKIGEDLIRANSYKIEWGGRFRTLYDPAHWQLKDWAGRAKISDDALFDRDTGEVIQWHRSPFSKEPARPTLTSGQDYMEYLRRNGRTWKTAMQSNSG